MYEYDELFESPEGVAYSSKDLLILSGISMSKDNLEYFTLIKDHSYICKISIRSSEYIEFYFDDAEEKDLLRIYKLSDIEKEQLMNILSADNNHVWKNIMFEKNELCDREVYSYNIPIPDYTQLPN